MFIHEKIEIGYDDLVVENGANGRRYLSPEGNKYPSITTVLGVLSKAGIAAWRARVGDEEANKISHRASTRGTAVHDIVEKYLDNEELPEVLPHITASLSNLKPSLSRIGRIFAQESPLYSKHLGVAGRVDCVGEYDGVPSIIDFKTSKKIKKKEWITSYFMQAAAYAIMWEERTGMPITNLVIIMDVDNESPQIYVEHRDNWTEKLFETIELYHKEQRQRPL
jgi:CRISPR/Cas system-associated exonuclease Cas4 (RecB family)|tara:strand:- start:556 stop:1224 length:669 start_codon:yes stop_codon:yes gene_type:complete